jgi:hypothetical protein
VTSDASTKVLFNSDGSVMLKAGSDATDFKFINFAGVPATDPNIVGMLWSDSGVLTISAG